MIGHLLYHDLRAYNVESEILAPLDKLGIAYQLEGEVLNGDPGSPVVDRRGTVIGIVDYIIDESKPTGPPNFIVHLPKSFKGLKL